MVYGIISQKNIYVGVLILVHLWAGGSIAQNDYGIHDPCSIVKENGTYYTFSTGRGVPYATSDDLCSWNWSGSVFGSGWPDWIDEYVDGFGGHFWAPQVFYMNGKWHVYYSCSSFGSQNSAIGLATSPTLDNPQWEDQGMVVNTNSSSNHNAIDADVMRTDEGSIWLIYGSYWAGIVMTELDSATGKPIDRDNLHYVVGGNPEAGYAMQHGEYYYMFFNRGRCCDGVNSTYYINVARSENPTGPFYDKNGEDASSGGGSVILQTNGRFIGPGHYGYFQEGNTEYMSYHYYDGNDNGASKLKISSLSWEQGWPVVNSEYDPCNPPEEEDCAGVMNGNAYIDNCGQCVGGTTGQEPCVQDCNGDWGQDAYIDECGVCVGGNTGIQSCTGSIQGEDAYEYDGIIESDNAGYTEDGYLNYTNETGSSATWGICSDSDFTGEVVFRYSNGSDASRNMSVLLNGSEQIPKIEFSATPSWTEWRGIKAELEFIEGENQLTLTSLGIEGGANIDAISFTNTNLYECETGVERNRTSDIRCSGIIFNKDRIIFHLEKTSEVRITLNSLKGEKLMDLYNGSSRKGWNSLRVDMSRINSGMYILTFKRALNTLSRKILITE